MLASADLDRSLAQIEERLTELGQALGSGDAIALEAACAALQGDVVSLGSRLRAVPRRALSDSQRQRWRGAEAQTGALREALVRAAAAQARALQALQIGDSPDGYGAQGGSLRIGSTGSLLA